MKKNIERRGKKEEGKKARGKKGRKEGATRHRSSFKFETT